MTFNGRRFDLSVLRARAMRHGIPCPYLFSKRVCYRYGDAHVDVADMLTDHGAARCAGLDAWAHLCGWPGKIGEAGADVAEMIAAGRLGDVQSYCMEDVAQTQGVALRLALARGVLRPDGYLAAARTLLAAIDAEPRLVRLTERVDRERVLTATPTTVAAPSMTPMSTTSTGEANVEAHDIDGARS